MVAKALACVIHESSGYRPKQVAVFFEEPPSAISPQRVCYTPCITFSNNKSAS